VYRQFPDVTCRGHAHRAPQLLIVLGLAPRCATIPLIITMIVALSSLDRVLDLCQWFAASARSYSQQLQAVESQSLR
jgi:hypothetical protein